MRFLILRNLSSGVSSKAIPKNRYGTILADFGKVGRYPSSPCLWHHSAIRIFDASTNFEKSPNLVFFFVNFRWSGSPIRRVFLWRALYSKIIYVEERLAVLHGTIQLWAPLTWGMIRERLDNSNNNIAHFWASQAPSKTTGQNLGPILTWAGGIWRIRYESEISFANHEIII